MRGHPWTHRAWMEVTVPPVCPALPQHTWGQMLLACRIPWVPCATPCPAPGPWQWGPTCRVLPGTLVMEPEAAVLPALLPCTGSGLSFSAESR